MTKKILKSTIVGLMIIGFSGCGYHQLDLWLQEIMHLK